MPINKKLIRDCDINSHCNSLANQYLILVTIFGAIISQEIEDDEELGILGSFLVALGEELALASETRIVCKVRLKEQQTLQNNSIDIVDVFDRGINYCSSNSNIKRKYIKKKYVKKVKKSPNK